jgi:hypothetical protein
MAAWTTSLTRATSSLTTPLVDPPGNTLSCFAGSFPRVVHVPHLIWSTFLLLLRPHVAKLYLTFGALAKAGAENPDRVTPFEGDKVGLPLEKG